MMGDREFKSVSSNHNMCGKKEIMKAAGDARREFNVATEEVLRVMEWLDRIPMSRNIKSLHREFSDGGKVSISFHLSARKVVLIAIWMICRPPCIAFTYAM